MPSPPEIQFISDAQGETLAAIVPNDLWYEIESERETAYLLKSEAMKWRLLEAQQRSEGTSLEDVREQLGI